METRALLSASSMLNAACISSGVIKTPPLAFFLTLSNLAVELGNWFNEL
jgi:hypothetical protein